MKPHYTEISIAIVINLPTCDKEESSESVNDK